MLELLILSGFAWLLFGDEKKPPPPKPPAAPPADPPAPPAAPAAA